jgi:glycosyltransferase involved in cell wall biosynthesis
MKGALKIAIGVHGRFHAFELARALIESGADVRVFTNYPAFIARRFGLPSERVRGNLAHGMVVRLAGRLDPQRRNLRQDERLHVWFGRWLARRLAREQWDASYTWSGVSREYLEANRCAGVRLMARGSAHIRAQAQLLAEEQDRTGVPQEQPNPLVMAREEREYTLADAVVTLSTFSRKSFLERGHSPERVKLMVSAARVDTFRATPQVVAERARRIRAGEPLRVLNVGTFSYRKGVHDWAAVVRAFPPDRFRFRFVGAVAPEATALARGLHGRMEFVERVTQAELPAQYAWGDVFLFPTIEDGFPAVMAQACAAGLPQLSTPNGAGEDLFREGENGWLRPIRRPDLLVEQLRWCDAHRSELAAMAERISGRFQQRDWSDAAGDFIRIVAEVRHAAATATVSPVGA